MYNIISIYIYIYIQHDSEMRMVASKNTHVPCLVQSGPFSLSTFLSRSVLVFGLGSALLCCTPYSVEISGCCSLFALRVRSGQNRSQLVHPKEINIGVGKRVYSREVVRSYGRGREVRTEKQIATWRINHSTSEIQSSTVSKRLPSCLFSYPVILSLPWLLSYPSIQHPHKLNHSSFIPQHILTFSHFGHAQPCRCHVQMVQGID